MKIDQTNVQAATRRLAEIKQAEAEIRAEVIAADTPEKRKLTALDAIQQRIFKAEILVARYGTQLREKEQRNDKRRDLRARLEALTARLEGLPAEGDN